MSSPTSVGLIVTAFDRRAYFADAVASVLRADPGSDRVQYLLLRNFEDPSIDLDLVRRGVRLVPDFSPDVGGTLYSALDHCDAEYLAFVDDDDLILPHRLRRFAEIRSEVPDLVYYHNAYAMFSTPGPLASQPPAVSERNRGDPRRSWSRHRPADGEPFLRFLAERSWEQNLSSTIVHRSALEHARAELSEVQAMTDTAAMIAAISTGGSLVFDRQVTTLVRRHTENVSKTVRDTRRRDATLDLLARLVARSPSTEVARDYLELRRARETVYNPVFGVRSTPAELRGAVRTIHRYWKRLRCWRDLGFLGLGTAALTAPAALPALRPVLVPR